jgi:hypothetical protein
MPFVWAKHSQSDHPELVEGVAPDEQPFRKLKAIGL